MDTPSKPDPNDARIPQHELEGLSPLCSRTIEDDDAYITDSVNTSPSENTLGTLVTAPQRGVCANTNSNSWLSTCSTFSPSSVKTRTRIITVPGRFVKTETRVNPILKNCTEECECSRAHEIHCMQA